MSANDEIHLKFRNKKKKKPGKLGYVDIVTMTCFLFNLHSSNEFQSQFAFGCRFAKYMWKKIRVPK